MKEIKTKVKDPEKIKEKHKKIAEAAVMLFSRYGFHKTSMRQIAEASNIELSYLYKYISSKDDILLLFYESLHERHFPLFDNFDQHPEEDPVEQLIEMINTYFKMSQGYYKQIMAAYTETKHLKKDYFQIVLKKEKQYSNALQRLIERGNQRGRFHVKDPLLSANFVTHLIIVDAARSWAYRDQRTKDETKDELIRFILNALGHSTTENDKETPAPGD